MNPFETNILSNRSCQTNFYLYLDEKNKKTKNNLKNGIKTFIKDKHSTQWSFHIHNILDVKSNCPNDCKYCYMKRLKNKFHNVDIENLNVVIDKKRVDKNFKKVKKGDEKMIMFPSSHDITVELVDDFIKVATKMLDAGHYLLIVTKPNLICINKMIDQLANYKNQIMFRLTITSNDLNLLNYFEHNAPKYEERKQCLINLFNNGFQTSISMEPFLSDPIPIINELQQYVTETIWIGLMSGINQMELDEEHKTHLENQYNKNNIMRIINDLRHNDKIMFKFSIFKLILK